MRWAGGILIALHTCKKYRQKYSDIHSFDNMTALDALRQQTRTKGNTYRIWLRIKD